MSREPLPLWKKLVFSLLTTTLFFGALELVLAGLGVVPEFYEKDPYAGFSSFAPHFVPARPSGGLILVTADNKLRLFHRQELARHKATGTFRIFTVGGSTTYGRPYGDATSFGGWLREFLPAADPSRQWEVINAGGISYASYRVASLMEELLAYEPDLFIIYSGHNEFLEERTYRSLLAAPRAVRSLGALASRTRLFTAARAGVQRWLGPESSIEATGLDDRVRTLLDGSVGPDAYHRDEELRANVLRHYRFSLARMVDMARSVGADVILVTPAANLSHCSPFKSQHVDGLHGAELARWEAEYEQALKAKAEGHWEEALVGLQRALVVDDRFAHAHYERGRVLDALGRHVEAKVAFERAREEDVCPLRALAPMISIVRETARERDVPLVDFVGLVEGESEHGIPGENFFFDHVHPTIEGNRKLAQALLSTMERMGLVRRGAAGDERALDAARRAVEARLDPRAHGIALSNLSRVLGWAGKLEEARVLALQATELAFDVAEVHQQAGICSQLTQNPDEAARHYRRAIELNPGFATAHSNLAVILEDKGELNAAADHYRQAIALLGEENAAYRESLRKALESLDSGQ